MKRFTLLASMAALFMVLTGCDKSDLSPTLTPELTETTPTESHFRHQFTGAEMDQMVAEFTGEPVDDLTEEEKFRIMADVRFEQLTGRKPKSNNGPTEAAAYRGENDWIAYAITKIKQTATTPDSEAIFIDDADVSTVGIINLNANANYSESAPIDYFQIYSFAYVLNNGTIVDFDNQNFFNYTCDGINFALSIFSSATLNTSGATTTLALLFCRFEIFTDF
ncbi:MAG: hypothetical protein AAFR05_05805 [Bacteroidota bacterium]